MWLEVIGVIVLQTTKYFTQKYSRSNDIYIIFPIKKSLQLGMF